MVNGTYVFTHPPFVLGVAISRIVWQPKEMLHYCAHTHLHVHHTMEQWTDEQMNYNTNIAHHEQTGYITLNIVDCFYVVQNNDVFKQNQPVAHIYMDTWIDLHK